MWLLFGSVIVMVRLRSLVGGHGKVELRRSTPDAARQQVRQDKAIRFAYQSHRQRVYLANICERELGHGQVAANFLPLLQAPAFC